MKEKISLIIFLLLLGVGSLSAQTKNAKSSKKTSRSAAALSSQGGGSAIKFEEYVHQIGTVKQGAVVSHKFKFTNVSRKPIEVKNATATCGCTVPDYPFIPIMPGEQGEIGVTFNTAHKLGHQKPTITVVTSAGTYYVSLEGEVTD